MQVIYTDGACSGNPGPGGWAYKALVQDRAGSPMTWSRGGHLPSTTSNRAELLAVLHALQDIALDKAQPTTVATDSQYVMQGVARLGRDSMLQTHVDLWQDLKAILKTYTNIDFRKVKGHAGDVHNTECDKLARSYSRGWRF